MNESYSEEISFDNTNRHFTRQALEIETENLLGRPEDKGLAALLRKFWKNQTVSRRFSYGILLMIAMSLVFISIGSKERTIRYIDYEQDSFFTITEPQGGQTWNIYVDQASSRVYYIDATSGVVEAESARAGTETKTRRQLSENIQSKNNASALVSLVHDFNTNELKTYHFVQAEFIEHAYCFKTRYQHKFELIPKALISKQYERQIKRTAHDNNGNEMHIYSLETPGSQHSAEVQYNHKGRLAHFTVVSGNSSAKYVATKPFEVERVKSLASQVGECYEYNLATKKAEPAYLDSSMKCPREKFSDQHLAMHLQKHNNLTQNQDESDPFQVVQDLAFKSQYGNWCGPRYGGFSSSCDCVEECNEIPWIASDDCKACCPAVDYTDAQCMQHDVCSNRHDIYGWGSDGCGKLNSSFLESIPCVCNYELMDDLEGQKLKAGCNGNDDCLVSGRIIRSVFQLHPCGCEVDRCWQVPHLRFGSSDFTIDIEWVNTCVNYETCMPSYICRTLMSENAYIPPSRVEAY